MRRKLSSSAALAMALLLGCSACAGRAGTPATSATSPQAPTATGEAADHGGPAPALIARASSTIVYVLATARSSAGGRLELFRSDNAGRSFRPVTAPAARSAVGNPLKVRAMTFINPADGIAILGTPEQPEPLMMTVNGAKSWHRIVLGGSGAVWAVAGHGSEAYALTLSCGKSENCRSPRLYRSVAGSLRWIRQPATGISGAAGAGGIGFSAWGSSVWLTVGNGEAAEIGLLGSTDSGRAFHQETALAAVACWSAATSVSVVWLSCSEGMSVAFQRFTVGSARSRLLPVTGAGTGNTFLDPLSDRIAYFGTALGSRAGLYLSRNSGRSFTRTGRLPGPDAGISTSVTFLNVRDGLALIDGSRLLRTTDTGASWTSVRL